MKMPNIDLKQNILIQHNGTGTILKLRSPVAPHPLAISTGSPPTIFVSVASLCDWLAPIIISGHTHSHASSPSMALVANDELQRRFAATTKGTTTSNN